MPSVSYVVNAFNKAAHLPLVLGSIRRQEGDFAREIIVLDGGSRDGAGAVARELIRGWADARVLEHRDRGPSAAFNVGGAAARMEHIHFVDGDDVLAPYATALLLDVVRRHAVPTVIAAGGFYADIAELERRFDRAAAFAAEVRVPAAPLHEMIRYAPSNMSGTLMRADLFRRVGGCDERVFIHDYSLSLRAARAAPVAFVDAVVWLGPADDRQRIMLGSKRQLMHDFSAALHGLLLDYPDLPARYGQLAFRRAAGRAYKWARREEGLRRPSVFFWLFLRSHLPWGGGDAARAVRRTLSAFELSAPVRRPPPQQADGAAG